MKGRVAIITGGSEGIGKFTAMKLAQEGANVAICARRAERLERAAMEIKRHATGEVMPIIADVNKPADVKRMVQSVVSRWGRVDILVNNAGTAATGPFETIGDDVWEADFQLKLLGAVRCSREVLPHMKQKHWGHIINVTSIAGRSAGPRSEPSSVSRAADIALTKALSKEYAEHGVLVNTVCIGLIKAGQHEATYEKHKQSQPGLTLEAFYAEMGKTVPLGPCWGDAGSRRHDYVPGVRTRQLYHGRGYQY